MNVSGPSRTSTRRRFLKSSAAAGAVAAVQPLWGLITPSKSGPSSLSLALNHGWMFLGKVAAPSAPLAITLPHCPVKLSWQEWDAASWEDVWLYRRSFPRLAHSEHLRTFLQFEGAMVTADVSLNGAALPQHKGGYLPFTFEITPLLKDTNTIEVQLDSRFQNVPPEGSPKGRAAVDYFVPGGMIRGVSLYAVPQTYISDVFAKPVDVLSPARRVEFLCTLDAASTLHESVRVTAVLNRNGHTIAHAQHDVSNMQSGPNEVSFTMSGLSDVKLWSCDDPQLYDVAVTLEIAGKPVHTYTTRIGFREARFTNDGFFLNGKKMQFFGLNRHELFPYTGYAMPDRVMRKDAEIIRRDFNCNIVRCSHYPQHKGFLDACDELGLMVWEEPPGWQYIGDQTFQDQVVENVRDMIHRDRNHASIVIWGIRVNESHNDPPLYTRTFALVKKLDDSRPASGSMTGFDNWQTQWQGDVFAYDDYHHSPSGRAEIRPPLNGIPYMLAETVGQFSYDVGGFHNKYRRAAEPAMQYQQAIYHAQAHENARAYDRMCGVIAWCAFEYGSPQNSYQGVKNPGVADVFRIPKLGASFYQAQVSASVRPVIQPNFYWQFGPEAPSGPGKAAAIFHNCERLEVFIDNKLHAKPEVDRKGFPHLLCPPSWVDFELDGHSSPELRIDGYVAGRKVLTRLFSSDRSKDKFVIAADDTSILTDGIDATRVVFRIVDAYGAPRLLAGGDVTLTLTGQGDLIGDRTFSLTESGGAGAVWVRSKPNASGPLKLTATHSTMGTQTVTIGTSEPALSTVL